MWIIRDEVERTMTQGTEPSELKALLCSNLSSGQSWQAQGTRGSRIDGGLSCQPGNTQKPKEHLKPSQDGRASKARIARKARKAEQGKNGLTARGSVRVTRLLPFRRCKLVMVTTQTNTNVPLCVCRLHLQYLLGERGKGTSTEVETRMSQSLIRQCSQDPFAAKHSAKWRHMMTDVPC